MKIQVLPPMSLLLFLVAGSPVPFQDDHLFQKMNTVGDLMAKNAQRYPESRDFIRNGMPILVDPVMSYEEKVGVLSEYFKTLGDGEWSEEQLFRKANWLLTMFNDVEVEFISKYFGEHLERGRVFFRKCLLRFSQEDYLTASSETRLKMLKDLVVEFNQF